MTRINHERATRNERTAASNREHEAGNRALINKANTYTPRPRPVSVGSGILFKNDRKEPDSKQPDYQGQVTMSGGSKYRLAAWIRTDKNGGKFMSLALSEED